MPTPPEASQRSGRKRGPYAKTKTKREAIIDSALEVFAASGYRGGSLRDIADRCGISEAGIFHHFSNKAALLEAVLEKQDRVTYAVLVEEGEENALRQTVRLAEDLHRSRGIMELFVALAGEAASIEHPAHEYFQRQRDLVRALFARTFESYDRRGRYKSALGYEEAATMAIAIFDGMHLQWLFNSEAVDMPTLVRHHLDLFVDEDWN